MVMYFPSATSVPKCIQQLGLGQAKASHLRLNLDPSCQWHEHNHVRQHLSPPKVWEKGQDVNSGTLKRITDLPHGVSTAVLQRAHTLIVWKMLLYHQIYGDQEHILMFCKSTFISLKAIILWGVN